MKKPAIALSLFSLTAILALSACGGGGSETADGALSTEKDGVTTTVVVPLPATDSGIKAVDAYKTKAGVADGFVYLSQTLKNDSSNVAFMCDPSVVDSTGAALKFMPASEFVGSIMNHAQEIGNSSLYKEGTSLYNSILQAEKAEPGQSATTYYIAIGNSTSVKSVKSGYTTEELMGRGCDVELS